MATSMISSSVLAAPPTRAQGLPSLGRAGSSFAVVCGTGKKIKTDKPFGSCQQQIEPDVAELIMMMNSDMHGESCLVLQELAVA
jgi:hypothetical protein